MPTAAQEIRNERLKILADDGDTGDWFGHAVAISGATVIVGAPFDADNGSDSGSAYLFDASTGEPVTRLLPSSGAEEDFFGYSVAISGTTAIVGAFRDDTPNGIDSGSAYLFDAATGTQIDRLLPRDGADEDGFGIAVAISGSIAIVGADDDDDNGTASGSAYIFDVSTGMQMAKLLPTDGAAFDSFGHAVAISDLTVIVGADDDDDNGSRSGSAYLFDAATGRQIAKMHPTDGAAGDLFGTSVAISGKTAIVGAWGDEDNGVRSGSAYLFDTTTGSQIAKLLPTDGAARVRFGFSVAISGSTAIVGASYDDVIGDDSGSAYLFDIATGGQIAKLLPTDGAARDRVGSAVAISGKTAVVGAWADDTPNGRDSGSVYLFDAGGSPPPNITLEYSGACPGRGTFTVTNATADGEVAIVYGLGTGPTTIPSGLPCAGTVLNVGNPNLSYRVVAADAAGTAVVTTSLPEIACGRLRVQALDLTKCETSDVVRP